MFNQDVFDRKVEELIAMSKSIEYVPAELKRDDDWTAAPKGLRRKDGKFFKVLMVLAKAAGGSSWIQPLLVEEGNQYDRHFCFKVAGNIVLPLRVTNGVVEAGVTVLNGAGSYGEPVFSVPRASLSNPDQVEVPEGGSTLWKRTVFTNVNRIAGRVNCYVSWDDESSSVRPRDKVVWFTREELAHLMDHEFMADAPSLALINWVLAEKFRPEAA